MPFFSVIMPVYNKAPSLEESLRSVYLQTYKNYELIAVDDGSNDGSLAILKRHEVEGRLNIFQRNTPGPGGYAARNYGVKQADSRWIVFLDADDIYLPDHLHLLHEAIVTNPDVRLFVSGYEKVALGERKKRKKILSTGVFSRKEALSAFAVSDFIHMNGVCLRRELFEDLGGFPEGRFKRGGDVYLWLKMFCTIDRFYYNEAVTSLWLLDNSCVTRNTQNLSHIHPAVELRRECGERLGRKERRLLDAAINRKVISWAVEKKNMGSSIKPDLISLTLSGMRPSLLLKTVLLLLPNAYFNPFRKVLKLYRIKQNNM